MDYKDKLEEAKRLYKTADGNQRYILEKLFPEVVESEDEKMIRIIEDVICTNKTEELVKTKYGLKLTDLADWLENKVIKKEWKPTKEQINALDEVYKTHGANSACRRIIITLLNDLKKL